MTSVGGSSSSRKRSSGRLSPRFHSPRYARMTSGWRWTSAGVPSAIFTPWSSATMRLARRAAAPLVNPVRALLLLLGGQAGDRLVEEQEPGLRRQRPAQLDLLLHPEGAVGHPALPGPLQGQGLDDLLAA